MKKLILSLGAFALLLSTVMNLLMIHRNQKLRELANSYNQQLSPPLRVKMPPLDGVDASQKPISLEVSNSNENTVVFVFSPECNVCRRNWKNWDWLIASRTGNAWRPVFVNTGPVTEQDFRTFHNLQASTLIEQASKNTVLAYRMYFTPETVVINHQGVIVGAWVGVLTAKEIHDFSHVANATT